MTPDPEETDLNPDDPDELGREDAPDDSLGDGDSEATPEEKWGT